MDRDPMVGPAPAEVPLPRAPLVRVLAQVRFAPRILKADQERAVVAEFQEALLGQYPFPAHEKGQQLTIGAAGAAQVEIESVEVWRFTDAPKDWRWRVSLGPDSVTLETAAYLSRDDFLGRLRTLLEAAERAVRPGPVTRIGLRYVDRLEGTVLEKVDTLLDRSVLGVVPTPLGKHARLSFGEALVAAPEEEASLRIRFGLLPPGVTFDPSTIAPIQKESWILDLDMFDEAQRPFVAAVVEARARAFAERIYGVFRALVTPVFLRHYGGGES